MRSGYSNPKKVLKWLDTAPSLRELCAAYPEEWAAVLGDISDGMRAEKAGDIRAQFAALAQRAGAAPSRPRKASRPTAKETISHHVRSRMVYLAIKNFELTAVSGVTEGAVRFNRLNRYIVNALMFTDGLKRKPVSLFWFRALWPLVTQKQLLMPLSKTQGIYCYYSRQLIQALAVLIGPRSCLEIAAGDGTLTRFLQDRGVKIVATDNLSWKNVVRFGDGVLARDAKEALAFYSPDIVICSWPPAGNDFERHVFRTRSVQTYVVIASRYQAAAGDWQTYHDQTSFSFAEEPQLSRLVLPPELESAVYVFQRIASER